MTSSKRMGHLASKAMQVKRHGDMSLKEIRELGASVESQRQDVSTRPQERKSDRRYGKPTK